MKLLLLSLILSISLLSCSKGSQSTPTPPTTPPRDTVIIITPPPAVTINYYLDSVYGGGINLGTSNMTFGGQNPHTSKFNAGTSAQVTIVATGGIKSVVHTDDADLFTFNIIMPNNHVPEVKDTATYPYVRVTSKTLGDNKVQLQFVKNKGGVGDGFGMVGDIRNINEALKPHTVNQLVNTFAPF